MAQLQTDLNVFLSSDEALLARVEAGGVEHLLLYLFIDTMALEMALLSIRRAKKRKSPQRTDPPRVKLLKLKMRIDPEKEEG